MAIKVKHGMGVSALVGGYDEGRARRAVDSARFSGPSRGGGQTSGPARRSERQQPQQRREIGGNRPPMAPRLRTEQQARASHRDPMGSGFPRLFGSRAPRQQNPLNTVLDVSDQNRSQWENYRQRMIQGGFGDPGAMPGHAANVADGGVGSQPAMRHTRKQRDEFNQLSQAYQDAVESGDYTDDELADIRRQIHARQMGIQPIPQMEEQGPTPDQRLADKTVQLPDGTVLVEDARGQWSPLETRQSKMQDRIDSLVQDAMRQGFETMDEVRDYVSMAIDLEREIEAQVMGIEQSGGQPVAQADPSVQGPSDSTDEQGWWQRAVAGPYSRIRGAVVGAMGGGGQPQMEQKDMESLQWARDHRDDPRAEKIMQYLEQKYEVVQ